MTPSNKSILIYYSSGLMSIDLLSLMIELKNIGHNVSFLTNSEEGVLHQKLKENGIKVFSKVYIKNKLFYLNHALYLSKFTKKHKIDIVYSHIQVNNFIATIAQYFSPSKFFMCRHHSDYVWKGNIKGAKLMDRFINKFSMNIVAISTKVSDQLIKVEGVKKSKVHQINLGYDFSLYPKPNLESVEKIKKELNSEIVLLNIGRMIPLKRQLLLIKSCSILIKKGYDLKLVILGDGNEKNKIEALIAKENVGKNVLLYGYVNNVIDYISASDLIVHPSESEASSTVGKEAALARTALLACNDVGDFDTYLTDEVGYPVNKNINEIMLSKEIEEAIKSKKDLNKKGELFYDLITEKFSMSNIILKYQNLFQ